MICVSGFSGSGKDEFCKGLEKASKDKDYYFLQTGLADPAKRHMADVYGFTEQQLFGESKYRNGGDLRYPKISNIESYYISGTYRIPINEAKDRLKFKKDYEQFSNGFIEVDPGDPNFWLSPREALQEYCEKMNQLYIKTWVEKGVKDQMKVVSGIYDYTRFFGLTGRDSIRNRKECFVTCFSDFRYLHEFKYVKNLPYRVEVHLVRIKNPKVPNPPYDHISETQQVSALDGEFDHVIVNDKDIDHLHKLAAEIVNGN